MNKQVQTEISRCWYSKNGWSMMMDFVAKKVVGLRSKASVKYSSWVRGRENDIWETLCSGICCCKLLEATIFFCFGSYGGDFFWIQLFPRKSWVFFIDSPSHHHIRDFWLMSSGEGGEETRQKGGIIGGKIPSEKRQIIHLLKISMGPPRRNIQTRFWKARQLSFRLQMHMFIGVCQKNPGANFESSITPPKDSKHFGYCHGSSLNFFVPLPDQWHWSFQTSRYTRGPADEGDFFWKWRFGQHPPEMDDLSSYILLACTKKD